MIYLLVKPHLTVRFLFTNLIIISGVYSTIEDQNGHQPKSADLFKVGVVNLNPSKLNLINEHVNQVKSEIKKIEGKIDKLQKNYSTLLTVQSQIYKRIANNEEKLNQILANTRLLNYNPNIHFPCYVQGQQGYKQDLDDYNHQNKNKRAIRNQRFLVGRSIEPTDFNHDLTNEFIQNFQNWQNKTDLKLTKIMNVITEIYREDKQLSLDLSKLNERQTNEDRTDLAELMRKEFKEQFSINKAELKSYISNVNENCLLSKTQNENLTFQLLALKDDLINPLARTNKYNQENSVFPPDDENNSLISKNELFIKSTSNLINKTIEEFRIDLNNVKQQILNRIDRENIRINERIYTLNNNYKNLNNLRNCNTTLSRQSNDHQIDDIDSHLRPTKFYSTTIASTSTLRPSVYQVTKKRDDDLNGIRSKSNTRVKLISPIKFGQITKRNCHTPETMSPTSCEDLFLDRVDCDGVYIVLFQNEAIRVYCELDDNGGSTVIMRRGRFHDNPLAKFNDNWSNYKKGFGSVEADFWLGLDKIHELTKNKNQMLIIDLESFDGQQITLKYNQFYIDNESNNYKLTIADPLQENSNYANLFLQHNGSSFATKDRNDINKCAKKFEGGWWYLNNSQCHTVLLNGLFYTENATPMHKEGIQWPNWLAKKYLKAVQMKIKERKFISN